MIKLIRNELYKIFHKKLIYVILILAIFGSIFFGAIEKGLSNNQGGIVTAANSMVVESYEKQGDTTSPEYIDAKVSYETSKIKQDRKIRSTSPEAFYIDNTVYNLYKDYYVASTQSYDQAEIDKTKKALDEAIAKLDNFGWREIVNKDLEEIDDKQCDYTSDKEDCLNQNQAQRLVLEYRLKHNIPYSDNYSSNELFAYPANYQSYMTSKDSNDEALSFQKKYEKAENEAHYKVSDYLIKNELLEDDTDSYPSGEDMVYKFSTPSFLVLIVLLTLSASSVAEEFNKGTIKQLLVKPYSRSKILLSKMVSVFIATIIVLFIVNISTTVISALFSGDITSIFDNKVIFNYKTHECMEMSYIKLSLLSLLYSLPMIILLGLFVFTLSIISTNTAFSLGMGFGAYISTEIFTMLMNRFKFLSYMPTVNYDLTQYMFGHMPDMEQLSFTKAVAVDIVSFVVLMIVCFVVFKKKDIKNQ